MLSVKKWYKIADSKEAIDGQANNMTVVEAGDKKIALVKLPNKLAACAINCPHAGGSLVNGFVDALGNIVCPLHKYKFSLLNGRNISGEGYHLKVYVIEQREDGVFVGLDESNRAE